MNHFRHVVYSLFFLAIAAIAFARPSFAQSTVFADEFNAGSLAGTWNVYGTDRWLSRTQFGNAPVFGTEGTTKFMRLRLDTYNPEYPGTALRGTEMHTKTQYGMGSGMQIEARVRAPGLPAGIIWAFFTLGERGTWPDTYSRDEIDFENLTSLASNEIWTNIYNDYNPNINLEGGSEMIKTAAGLNRNNWTTYKIKWYPDRVEWWVNVGSGADILIRSENNPALVTDDPQSVRFNIWATDSNWSTAYGDLPLTTNASQNTPYYFDVDYVRVTSLGARGTVGDGDGLQGNYYDNADLTGKTFSRVDQRVKFDWQYGAPNSSWDSNTFSARWTGKVQAMFSETYTFYVKSDDGARLWVNNKQIINQWNNQGTTEYKGTIALVAGQKYDIKLEYFENIGGANALLSWSSPSTSKTVVPKSQLYSGYVAPPPPPPPTDTTPPSASIFSPANNGSYKVVYGANGTAADAGGSGLASVKVTLQRKSDNLYYTGSGWSATKTELAVDGTANWNWGFPYLADGQYAMQAIARDVAANIGRSSVSTFTVSSGDSVPPTASITTPINTYTYNNLTAATGTAADNIGVTSVRVTLQRQSDSRYWDGSAWSTPITENAVSGTTNWSFTLPTLTDGNYFLRAIARDAVGNSGTSSVTQFLVDKVAPSVAVIEPKAKSYPSIPAANGTAADNNGLYEVRCILQRTSDGRYWNGSQWVTTWTENLANGTANWTFTMPTLSSGSYSFWAVARDWGGNQTYANSVNFTVQ